jgi:hypothetical protein
LWRRPRPKLGCGTKERRRRRWKMVKSKGKAAPMLRDVGEGEDITPSVINFFTT